MIVIYKNGKGDDEYFEMKGEGVTTNEVVFMVQSGIKLLQKAGATDENIKKALNEMITNKEDE